MMEGVGCRSLQRQVTVMSMNLNARLDELQTRGDRQFETDIALCEIRSQLDNLTKSMESCQSDVIEVKRDIAMMKTEVDQVNQIRSEIEELRVYVDRLEEQTHRRKLRLLQQVTDYFIIIVSDCSCACSYKCVVYALHGLKNYIVYVVARTYCTRIQLAIRSRSYFRMPPSNG